MKNKTFASIEDAVNEIKNGKMVIVVDDENRENEGDLIMAAEKINAKSINFMITHARGLICVPMIEEDLQRLNISLMTAENTERHRTQFTVSVDAKENTTTGISAYDRAETIKVLANSNSRPEYLQRPGHIFPLKAQPGGVLKRAGHTEAAVDLAKIAGLKPVGVICEIIKDDGDMARLDDLKVFAEKHNLSIITIQDLIKYRQKKEKLIFRVAEADLPTKFGHFKIIGYESPITDEHHVALVKGDVAGKKNILVRVHSKCLTGDTFHSLRCDCGEQLENSMLAIEEEGLGVLVYMHQEGRGIGLINKIKAYHLQDTGKDTVQANEELGFKNDLRDYGLGAQILKDLGLTTIRILTNNPKKIIGLRGYGIEIVERIPINTIPNKKNIDYLRTKKDKMGHLLDV
ncbi:MAG: bifunctional 3,4-dihydroxy-2-butanone-4-phosphate synthase/GTP cyclohydrolase II [Candidatus Cloacimonadota bacterium]|nr:bifunctional 3,4-dihydroxy-2-butanone-4-phosphate synthase/GTP cyclohydrolase II [Candidatus Cloacimonadota bacterium]